ncbi:MAG: hypothetical protein ACRC7P_08480, partial [Enterovibrio sp.]
MSVIRVAVLAFDGVSLFHLSVPGLVFGTVQTGDNQPHYEVNYCAEQPGLIASDQGISIAVTHGLALMQES